MGYLSQAFAIASFALSIIAIFVPVLGVFMAGLSGILAWGSYGRLIALGFAASIINIINILLLSPTFLIPIALESSKRTPDQSMTLKIWIIILAIQVIALVLLISNLIIFKLLRDRNRIKDPTTKQTIPNVKQSENNDISANHHITKSPGSYIPRPPGSIIETTKDVRGILSDRDNLNLEIAENGKNSSAEDCTEIIKIDKNNESKQGQFSPTPVFVSLFLLGAIIWGVFNFALLEESYVPLSRVYENIQNTNNTLAKYPEPNFSTQKSVTDMADKESPTIIPPDTKKLLPNTTITQKMLDEAWGDLKPDSKKLELSSRPFETQKPKNPILESRATPTKAEDKLYYYYAIKLKTGKRIVTKNAIIHEDAVDYIDRNGNMTSINRNLIQSLKRYYYKHKD